MSRTRTRRRASQKEKRTTTPYLQIPYRQLRNPWPPYQIASEERIEEIHNASMHILENTGIRFQDQEALDLWQKAGAKVDHAAQHVWLDRDLIMELIAQAPSSFTIRARNPRRSRFLGENAINFFSHAGMVFVRDLERGRRPGTKADLITLAKLGQMSNIIHFAPVHGVVMHDVPVYAKHLQSYWLGAMLSDKPLFGTSHGRIIAGDVVAMAKIHFGGKLEAEKGPITGGVVNVNSRLFMMIVCWAA